MANYRIMRFIGDSIADDISRKRRDSAALQFERLVWRALDAQGLRDRLIAQESMKKAKLAYEHNRATVCFLVGDHYVTFEATR